LLLIPELPDSFHSCMYYYSYHKTNQMH